MAHLQEIYGLCKRVEVHLHFWGIMEEALLCVPFSSPFPKQLFCDHLLLGGCNLWAAFAPHNKASSRFATNV